MTDNRGKPHGGWYVVVALQVTKNWTANRGPFPLPPTRAIGPISWTRARELIAAWESEFGENTATLTEKIPRQATLVRAA